MILLIVLCVLTTPPQPRPLPIGRSFSAPVTFTPYTPRLDVTAVHFNTAGLKCQVHSCPLRAVDVPIGYGHYFVIDIDGSVSAESKEHDLTAVVRFPNTVSAINTGFCMPGSSDPISAVQLVCDECIQAEREWYLSRERSRNAPASRPHRDSSPK